MPPGFTWWGRDARRIQPAARLFGRPISPARSYGPGNWDPPLLTLLLLGWRHRRSAYMRSAQLTKRHPTLNWGVPSLRSTILTVTRSGSDSSAHQIETEC